MSKGHRSEVPELYCVFASKTLQRKAPSEGCLLLASDKSLPRSRKTPFDLGCSRDTSRGCVGRRCTVLSYTFRSHPYQNTVERGCCSKVFFGLRNNDADLHEPAIHHDIFRSRPKGVFVASAYNCEQNTEAYRDREQNGFLQEMEANGR